MNLEINKDQFLKILIYILPAALISGPLISDGIVIIMSLFVINEIISKKKYFLFKNKAILLFLLFVFILCISSILSDNPISSLRSSFLYIRFGLFILGIIYILENVDKNFYNFFFYIILATIICLLFFATIQFFYIDLPFIDYPRVDSKRVSSFFGDEKIMGSYLLKILPLTLYLMFKMKIRIEYIFLLFLIFFYGILISGERTSLILSLILGFLLFFINYSWKKKFLFLGIFIILFILMLMNSQVLNQRIIFETYSDIMADNLLYDNFNIFSTGHTYYFITSINMFLSNNIIGIGPNLFREVCAYQEYYLGKEIMSCSTHPHNFYFQLLAETGLLGFLFLFSFFLYLSFKILRFLFKKELFENYKYCLLLSIFISIFPISSHGNFFNNWNSISIFLPLAFFIKEFNLITFKK